MFKKSDIELKYENLKKIGDDTAIEFERLTKKYQENPDTLCEDYDEVIKRSIIAIIANFNTIGALRDDVIRNTDILIRNREFICDKYSNNGSCNYQK